MKWLESFVGWFVSAPINTQTVVLAAGLVFLWIFKDLISATLTQLIPDLVAVAVGRKKISEIQISPLSKMSIPFEAGRQETLFFCRTVVLPEGRARILLENEINTARRRSKSVTWVLADVEMISTTFVKALSTVLRNVVDNNHVSLTVVFPRPGVCPALDVLRADITSRIEANGASCIVLRIDGEDRRSSTLP